MIDAFNKSISEEALSTFSCASCSGKGFVKDKRLLGLDEFDLKLLRHSDHPSWFEDDVKLQPQPDPVFG